MRARLSKWILDTLGWKIRVDPPDIDKYVVIAAFHTSNWDFPLGIMAVWSIRLKVFWMGKHTLFHWPYGWFFRAIGGIPVRRGKGLNYIGQMAERFEHTDHLVLALAPEGTRSKTDHWKSGFHYIARAANVPIVLGYFDYPKKEMGLGDVFYPTDDIEADMARIRTFYADKRGKNPEQESAARLQKTE
jgi:1-acyl-sn-glycerol-3-phosphate acyltransferase